METEELKQIGYQTELKRRNERLGRPWTDRGGDLEMKRNSRAEPKKFEASRDPNYKTDIPKASRRRRLYCSASSYKTKY
jgi:hypothetical protein